MQDEVVLLESDITYSAGGEVLHCPVVEATAGPAKTKLILDTGSSAHVLTRSFVRRAGFAMEPCEPGTDHAGASVESWLVGDVQLKVGGVELPLRNVVAIDGPEPFEEWGVGGFLSPQSLHPTASVVLDLQAPRLLIVASTHSDLDDWLENQFPGHRLATLDREPNEGVAVRAAVLPFPAVTALVNTGTPDTEFAATAVPGLSAQQATAGGFGVSGYSVNGERVANQVLMLGDAKVDVPLLFVRDDFPPQHGSGHIGMDVLRGTILAISPDPQEPVRWLTPA